MTAILETVPAGELIGSQRPVFASMSHTFHKYRVGDEPVAGYRLTGHLGAGGFGEVWKATAPGGTEVALKIIDLTGQQGVQEFASLRVVKKVRHPNLISLQAFWMKDEDGKIVDEAGESGQGGITATALLAESKKAPTQVSPAAVTAAFARPVELLIAMQLGAMSLHKRLEECRAQGMAGVPIAELLEYLEQAARGIDFLNKPIHDLGKGPVPIVHGDVKPHNILVVGDAAVVCDFGLARAVETLRKTSMAPVTVAYAAPESFKGKVTPTSDQYSLAITYVELRTGQLPFDETMTPYQVMEAHVLRTLDFSRLPEPERLVVSRATESSPDDRWPSSRDMILALRHAVAQTGELALRPGEAAFVSGPTSSHSLTARPKPQDTDLPTRHPVDPHQNTMQIGGRTPAEGLSLQTAPAPAERVRPSDSLAETAILGVQGTVVTPPVKKSKTGIFVTVGVAAAVSLAVVFAPRLFNSSARGGRNPTALRGQDASPEDIVPEAGDPNGTFIKDVQKKINHVQFSEAVDLLNEPPSSLPDYQKEALHKRLHNAYVADIDSQVQSRSFAPALAELDDAPGGVGLTDEEKTQARDKIRLAWLAEATEQFQNDQPTRALPIAKKMLTSFAGDRDALLLIARSELRQGDAAAANKTLGQLPVTSELPAEYQPLVAAHRLLTPSSAAAGDTGGLLDGFVEYAGFAKEGSATGALALNSWEQSRLAGLQKSMIDGAVRSLATATYDEAKVVSEKLEKVDPFEETRAAVVKALIENGVKKRVPPTTAAAALGNPFGDAATAAEAFKLLELASKIKNTDEVQPQDVELRHIREMWVNLALAAKWKRVPAELVAHTQTTRLVANPTLASDALPIALVAFTTHATARGDLPVAIQAAERAAELYQKQFPVGDREAETLYKDYLQPAISVADSLAAEKSPPPDLDKFYATVAEFIRHYQRATWPFPDKQAQIEWLLTKAIKLNPKVANYLTKRGVARISQTPPNVQGALDDAGEARKIDANFPAAYALEGHALIYRSRGQATSDARAADLNQAVAQCKSAVEKSKADDKDRAMHLLYLSMAQLEKGVTDTDTKAKKELLKQAKDNAEKAVELEKDKAYPDYAYTALANALEDLAWVLGEQPEMNYPAAIDAFSKAIATNYAAADPLIGRARCYYKAVADSKVDPKVLDRTADEAIAAAIEDLKKAKELNSKLVEPDLWLGKAYQLQKKFADADAALGDAVKLAQDQKLPEVALYLTEWARNATLNTDFGDAERDKQLRDRTEQLKKAPSIGGSSSAKQAALLIGQSLRDMNKAIKEYDAVLIEYDKADPAKPLDPAKADGSDSSLLLARAWCRLALPSTQWNLTAAEATIKDAARVVQLKPGAHLEALADWCSAKAKLQSYVSNSASFTDAKKQEFLKGAVDDARKAIEAAPNDPGSWEWRWIGAKAFGAIVKRSGPAVTAESLKAQAAEARQWIDDAIAAAAKRSDLAGQLEALQRDQQELEQTLTVKGLPRA